MTNGTDDVLIGFDVRLLAHGLPAPVRDPAIRALHLPRSDLRNLISFDRNLCPQRFVHRERLDAGQSLPPEGIVVEGQENIGFDLFYLWDDLFAMLAHYSLGQTEDVGLAYAILSLEGMDVLPPADPMYEVLIATQSNPSKVGADWPLLGFDVVNLYFQSFLGSFDLSRTMTPAERLSLAKATNALGLLGRREDCVPVVALANRAVADHGPFFALATYLLWDRGFDLLPIDG